MRTARYQYHTGTKIILVHRYGPGKPFGSCSHKSPDTTRYLKRFVRWNWRRKHDFAAEEKKELVKERPIRRDKTTISLSSLTL
ncbi:hypothetical protein BHE74_00051429 [Ensete ventricosum]|nr:hypothetical protein BHE74_00051429 [Ensete ventricosum]